MEDIIVHFKNSNGLFIVLASLITGTVGILTTILISRTSMFTMERTLEINGQREAIKLKVKKLEELLIEYTKWSDSCSCTHHKGIGFNLGAYDKETIFDKNDKSEIPESKNAMIKFDVLAKIYLKQESIKLYKTIEERQARIIEMIVTNLPSKENAHKIIELRELLTKDEKLFKQMIVEEIKELINNNG